jgi:hypothetical protein
MSTWTSPPKIVNKRLKTKDELLWNVNISRHTMLNKSRWSSSIELGPSFFFFPSLEKKDKDDEVEYNWKKKKT